MKRYALVEFGKPLQEIESPDPVPTGTDCLLYTSPSPRD